MAAKLHELLAAEKAVTGPWKTLKDETAAKFKNPHYFEGHTKSLKMLEDSPANLALQESAKEDKPVVTNVHDTLEYTLGIWMRSEDLQAQKNAANAVARGTVMWQGKPLLQNLPIDSLLGLEARLKEIRELIAAAPTLDASQNWHADANTGKHIWATEPGQTIKTEKVMTPVQMSPATQHHPAQVASVTKDVTVGLFQLIKRSGACTAVEKSNALVLIDNLAVEVKQARMRANETEVPNIKIAKTLVDLIMSPFKA